MNKTDSLLVYSCAFWGFFCRFGHSWNHCHSLHKTKSRQHSQISIVSSRSTLRGGLRLEKSIPAAIFSRRAKAPSFSNLGECFVVKNPHSLCWKWAFSASDSTIASFLQQMMILKMDTELGSEVKLTPPDGVQSFHVQHLPHPHSGISDRFIVTSDQWHSEATLRDIDRQTRQQNLNILRGFHRDIKICYQRQRDHSKMNGIPLRNAAKVRDIPHTGNSGKLIAWFVCWCPVASPRYAIGRS